MILFTHPTLNANVRHAAVALAEAGLLDEFMTTVCWNPPRPLEAFIPPKVRRQLARRAIPRELADRTRCFPLREAGRHACGRMGLSWLARHEKGIFSIDAVYRALDRAAARRIEADRNITGVYAYEDGAAASFAVAKRRGIACFYDLPIGYWRAAHAIYDEEKEREPEWACTLSGLLDSKEKCLRKDEELRLADSVFVASTFTRDTLKLAPMAADCKIEVIPYGAPPRAAAVERAPRHAGGRLRVLFVGALGQRKGLSYLLKAVEMAAPGVDLTLIGRPVGEGCAHLDAAMKKYRWIPSLSHGDVLREMAAHDVLVFPSLFEGFGLVILEAMAQGLPVITTAHTAGPDLIRDSHDGFIVPIRSAEAIATHLDALASSDEMINEMSRAARDTASTFTWQRYRRALAHSVAGSINAGAAIHA